MRILQASATTHDLPAMVRFFREVLELPVEATGEEATVRLGGSLLRLAATGPLAGHLHLAFDVPPASFDQGKRWLSSRVPLLSEGGVDEFGFSSAWNSRSVYFEAPDGTVLELIARRDAAREAPGAFGPSHLLCISEVGVAVPDVPAAVHALRTDAGLALYAQEQPGGNFAAVGDVWGLLILVGDGRPWFPTKDRLAHPRPLRIEATGPRPERYRLTDEAVLVVPQGSTG